MSANKDNLQFRIITLALLMVAHLIAFSSPDTLVAHNYSISYSTFDTILIGSEPDYPPYCIVDEDGQPDGFSIELFMAAAKAAGLQVKIKIGIWEVIKNELADGKIDALPLVGRTPEREEIFGFTLPYLKLHGAVFVRKDTKDIHSLRDLTEKKLIIMKGDNADEYARRMNLSEDIINTNTFEEAFQMLANGEGDAVITQRIMGLRLLENMEISTIKPLDIQLPEFRQDFCFAVKKGNQKLLNQLNEGLSVVIANDTYQQIYFKWFGPAIKEELSTEDIVRIALFIFFPLVIILVVLWVLLLRKEVKRRTRRLRNEITNHKNTWHELTLKQEKLAASEDQIRLLLDSTAEGIYGIDENGDCTLINKSAIQILGYESDTEIIGKNMHNQIHHTKVDGSPYPKNECAIYNSLIQGRGAHVDDEVLWKKDGSNFQAEYYSYPIQQHEKVVGAVVTFWDITEKKRTEKELIKLTEELELTVKKRTAELNEKVLKLDKSQQAMLFMVEDLNRITAELKNERRKLELSNKELEAFTYSVSHDLRAPMRAINGFSNFLLEDYADKLDQEGRRYLDTIKKNAIKMDKLITDLLSLSRVTKADLVYTTVDMEQMATRAFEDMATTNEKQDFNLKIINLPSIKGDVTLLTQVWQNLIGNALKYSSNSIEKNIEITATDSKNEVVYKISDSGAGFNEKYKDKLFGMFQRLHRDNEFEGTGVGLAIVKRIIIRHGGRVWAEGEVGQGARFYFALPKQS